MNAMREVHVEKVVVNIGVGEAGERLVKAQKVLEMVTGQKSVETISKTVNRDLGIRKGMPLGCKVTLRGETAENFLNQALAIRERRVPEYSFDKEGNMSFGISDYTDFEGMKYGSTTPRSVSSEWTSASSSGGPVRGSPRGPCSRGGSPRATASTATRRSST